MTFFLQSFVRRSALEFRKFSPMGYGAVFPYIPYYPAEASLGKVESVLAEALGRSASEIGAWWKAYEEVDRSEKYGARFGESKTLSREEAFAFHCVLQSSGAGLKNVLEIGTQEGISTRKILDSLRYLGIPAAVTCFDIYDGVKHFSKKEAELRLEDITDHVDKVLDSFATPGVIFLDARPYHLIENVVRAVLRRKDWKLVIHDCSPFICNPRPLVGTSQEVSSATGIWERHVLARVFGVINPLSRKLDHVDTPTHRLRILPTQHGLALVLPHP